MLGVEAFRRLLDRESFPVGPDDLALPGVDVDRMFRAPVAHRMRIAPLLAAVAKLTIESSSITVDSTLLQRFPGYRHRSAETTTSRPDVAVDALVERDLDAAPGVLPPANLPVVRCRRGRLHGANGVARRH